MTGIIFTDAQLARAVAEQDITPAFQPVVRLADGGITGTEVLARWQLPDGRAVPPDAFIPRAEALGLMVTLTAGLMTRVSGLLRARTPALSGPLTVGFNAGPSCLVSPVFERGCRDFMAAFPAGNVRLAVEVTEREPLTAALAAPLFRLKAAGVTVVLDDYGTGYATEDALDLIQPGVVKTDRSLTRLSGVGDPEGRLERCLKRLRARPGLQILAEGVETEEELKWLRSRGVSLVQGYLFGRPASLVESGRASG